MPSSLSKYLLFGQLALLILAGFAAQEDHAVPARPTGLIPLDGRQIAEIVKTRRRIDKVGLNWLGLERVNEVRSRRGLTLTDPQSAKPVGREVESSIRVAVPVPPAAMISGLERASDLPVSVDNSRLKYFPPIRSQGALGSCASFVATYYQLSYMTAIQRDVDIRDGDDNTTKYSPKWSYNIINGGRDSGSTFPDNFALLEEHGACTWAELPYDTNYRAWCLDPAAWRSALSVRTEPVQYIWNTSSDSGIALAKELLTNGYVLTFGTYVNSWRYIFIQDDPSTTDDDSETSKIVAHWLGGASGSHAMTIVGYNDAIWADVNRDGLIDPAEKGAFRVANSWGDQWGDQGFTWLAYDALRAVSAVPSGPSEDRIGAFQGDMVFVLTVRDAYSPSLIAEFRVNHLKRDQIKLTLGTSDTAVTVPSTIWAPAAFQNQGGAYAFDGSMSAVTATFVLDFADLLVEDGGPLRYYLGMSDNEENDPATLTAFKIVDLTTDPPTEVDSTLVPQYADDGQQIYAYVDYTYSGPVHDHPPQILDARVLPASGSTAVTYGYEVHYYDQDGDPPSVSRVVIDGTPRTMTFAAGDSASDGRYRYETTLSVGSHSYFFEFEDGRGRSSRVPILGPAPGPDVYAFLLGGLSPWKATAGGPPFALTVYGTFAEPHFVDDVVVMWDGTDRPTTFVDAFQLTASIGAEDLMLGRVVPIAVRHPAGGMSDELAFTVENPRPLITSLSESRTDAGGPGFVLSLFGSGFVPYSSVLWEGSPRTTTYVSGSELRASVLDTDIVLDGRFDVVVSNPPPGGGTDTRAFGVSGFYITTYAPQTVAAGQTATFPCLVGSNSDGAYEGTVSLSCTGLPRGCTAAFSPQALIPGEYPPKPIVLTITTTAPQDAGMTLASMRSGRFPPEAFALALLLPSLLLGFVHRGPAVRAASRRGRLAGVALLCLAVWLSSCGAGGGGHTDNRGTPAGTYKITVNAVSGNATKSATVTLIVT